MGVLAMDCDVGNSIEPVTRHVEYTLIFAHEMSRDWRKKWFPNRMGTSITFPVLQVNQGRKNIFEMVLRYRKLQDKKIFLRVASGIFT